MPGLATKVVYARPTDLWDHRIPALLRGVLRLLETYAAEAVRGAWTRTDGEARLVQMTMEKTIADFRASVSPNLLADGDFIDWRYVEQQQQSASLAVRDIQTLVDSGELHRDRLAAFLRTKPAAYPLFLDLIAFNTSGSQVEKWGLPQFIEPNSERANWVAGQLLHVGLARVLEPSASVEALLRVAEVYKDTGTTFLIRTPELIEDGLRSVLGAAFPGIGVAKRKLMLGESGLSVNPDLVFGGGRGVGDVKYRYLGPDWNRADFNQLVAFATAFRCNRAILLGFVRNASVSRPRSVPVGSVLASAFGWNASSAVAPEESASQLANQVEGWLATL